MYKSAFCLFNPRRYASLFSLISIRPFPKLYYTPPNKRHDLSRYSKSTKKRDKHRRLTARIVLERGWLVLGLEAHAALAVELGRAVEAGVRMARVMGLLILSGAEAVVISRLVVAGVVRGREVAVASRRPQLADVAAGVRAQVRAVARRLEVRVRRRLVIWVVRCKRRTIVSLVDKTHAYQKIEV